MRRMIPTLLLSLTFGLIVPVPPAGAVEFPADIVYDQCDTRWRDQVMGPPGSCEDTICTVGAYLTCWAMLLSWQAGQAGAPDPGQLNAWLLANGGYVGCAVVNNGVADDYDGAGAGVEWLGTVSLPFDDWAALDAELASGDGLPAVCVSYASHWVIVYERSGPSGAPSSYRVLDPALPYSATRTLAGYPSGGRTIFALSRFSGRFPLGTPAGVDVDGALPPGARPGGRGVAARPPRGPVGRRR